MDTQRDARLLAPHNTSGEMATPVSLDAEPGPPALPMDEAADFLSSARGTQVLEPGGPATSQVLSPGGPATSPSPALAIRQPATHAEPQTMLQSTPAVQTPGIPVTGSLGKGAGGVPLTMHPSARSFPQVPQVGEEIADLGQELGSALIQRRTAERRSIFAQRGTLGPDDSPYQNHTFDPSIDYRGVEWGYPVPQEEWERRVYVELNLATDLRHEGKGARPECHACRVRGSRTVQLAKCII
eukprot:4577416-Amphidinium_carterae.1